MAGNRAITTKDKSVWAIDDHTAIARCSNSVKNYQKKGRGRSYGVIERKLHMRFYWQYLHIDRL